MANALFGREGFAGCGGGGVVVRSTVGACGATVFAGGGGELGVEARAGSAVGAAIGSGVTIGAAGDVPTDGSDGSGGCGVERITWTRGGGVD